MVELHHHQLDKEDKVWSFHPWDMEDKEELSFHLLDSEDKEELSFHLLDREDKEELSFHLLDREDKEEHWQMGYNQNHHRVEAEQDTEAGLMQEDKVMLQDRAGTEEHMMHQVLPKEDSHCWHIQMGLEEAVVDTSSEWKEEEGSQAGHSVETSAVVLASEDSQGE
jgi:hypothetical protein